MALSGIGNNNITGADHQREILVATYAYQNGNGGHDPTAPYDGYDESDDTGERPESPECKNRVGDKTR